MKMKGKRERVPKAKRVREAFAQLKRYLRCWREERFEMEAGARLHTMFKSLDPPLSQKRATKWTFFIICGMCEEH